MQTRGTFPELYAGRSKSKRHARLESDSSFAVKGRGPRQSANNPKTFAGRRAASHTKAYGK